MIKNGMRPVHPGEVLLEEFMKPSDPPINANTLAKLWKCRQIGSQRSSKDTEGSPAIQPYGSQLFLIRPLSLDEPAENL